MKLPFIVWNTTGAVPYNSGQTVIRVKNCNGFVAVNTGDEIAEVNGHILYPGVPGTNIGDSKTYGGNLYEIYKGNINIKFQTGGGGNPEITIEQKYYVIDDDQLIT